MSKPQIKWFGQSENQSTPPKPPKRKNQFTAFSEADKQFLRDHWQDMTNLEIAEALGRTRSSIQSMGSDMGLKKTPEALSKALSKQWRNKKHNGKLVAWSEQDLQFVRDHYATMGNVELGKKLGRSPGAVKRKGQGEMGLRKTAEAIKALQKRPNGGQFKKGNLPQTTIYDEGLVIRPRHHKESGLTYLYIKISHGHWQQYHQWMWIRDHGPIPEGHIVVFRNKDQTDVRPENLELITQKENSRRNSASTNLPDGYVAHTIAWRDKPLQQLILQEAPELIELKRAELQLRRTLKQATTNE